MGARQWSDGFGLARPSNTTPVVVLRFEGDTPEALARIQASFRRAILAVAPDARLRSDRSSPRKCARELGVDEPKAVSSELLRLRTDGAAAALVTRLGGVPDALAACGIRLDISRQRVDRAALDLLRNLAVATDVPGAERAMARGDAVNVSERRPALHTALRSIDGATFGAPPEITNAVRGELDRARRFADDVRTGAWRGASGRPIDAVVNIGIGGSDSGPRLVCDALAHLADGPAVHFLSNVDGHAMARLLPRLDPQTTLAIVSSKSFTTRETLLNAATFVHWFRAAGIEGAGLTRHIVAVSARPDAALGLQLPEIQQFMLWDWVGGRFSVWSTIGLPAMLAIGPQRFTEFLGGAHALDRHALDAPLERNLPATLALLAFWNSVVLQIPATACCRTTIGCARWSPGSSSSRWRASARAALQTASD